MVTNVTWCQLSSHSNQVRRFNVDISGNLDSRDRSFLKASFHQHNVGYSGGIAPIGAAFFQIGHGQISRLLRSSRRAKSLANLKPFHQGDRKSVMSWTGILPMAWLQTWRESHSDRCQCPTGPVPYHKPARVIDVQKNFLVETPSCKYLALSYWARRLQTLCQLLLGPT